jgi:hypothetical protein
MAKYWIYPMCIFALNYYYLQEQSNKICFYPEVHNEMKAQILATFQQQVSARSLYRHQQFLTAANFSYRCACTIYGRQQFELAKIRLRHDPSISKVVVLYCFPKEIH